MKIKKGFVLRPTLGYTLVIATGDLAETYDGMIKLNEPCADVWRWIEEGLERDALIAKFSETYGVDAETATRDVDGVIESMTSAGVFE